jgi:hypothetical protein
MSLDNFLVRPRRKAVEKFASADAWSRLTLDDQAELVNQVAGLPTSVTDEDLAAKQFDALMLRTQLAVLRAEASFNGLKTKMSRSQAFWRRSRTSRWWPRSSPLFTKSRATTSGGMSPRPCWKACAGVCAR